MKPDELSTVLPDLIRFEGLHRHLYLDSRGYPTTGIGNLVKTVEYSLTLPWGIADQVAVENEVRHDYARVGNMKPNLPARDYWTFGALQLPESFARELATRRLENEFVPALVRIFPAFESFPLPAKSALIDMVYGLGEGRDGNVSKGMKATGLRAFKNLRRAIAKLDWQDASACCRVSSRRDERNEWVRAKFLEAT